MARNDGFSLWAARLCLGAVAALGVLGMYYGNVRFAPIAAGFGILAAVCYAERRGRRLRLGSSPVRRPSLTSGNAPRISPHPTHPLGS
jgi:hypothetical protein